MLTIEHVAGDGGEEQGQYIRYDPNSLLYANPRFMRLLAGHLQAKAAWLVARRDGICVGALPFLEKEGPLGTVYNSLAYYGSNGGVIQHECDEEAKAFLIRAFYKHAQEHNACSATIITNPLEQDSDMYEVHADFTYRDERIGQITHFPDMSTTHELMTHFQDPRPRNIRRAIKEGVVVEKTQSPAAIDFLYKTHVDNMTGIGGSPKRKTFFDDMQKLMLKEDWAVFKADLNGQPIAALLVFYFNKTVEYFTPVIIEEYRNTQALVLAIYTAMRDAIGLGYANWNWGGTWLSQGGVYDFKKRWDTTEYRYYYYTKVFDSRVIACAPDYLQNHYYGFYLLPYKYLVKKE